MQKYIYMYVQEIYDTFWSNQIQGFLGTNKLIIGIRINISIKMVLFIYTV